MGNEVNTNYIQGKVRFADFMYGNNDGKIDKNESAAKALFEASVKEDYKNEFIDKATFREAMGLFTEPKAEKTSRAEKKEARAERKEQKQADKTNNENRKAAYAELTKVVSQGATLDNVQETLAKRLTNPMYKEALAEVDTIINQIEMIGFNSKKDVENLKKAIKNKMYLDGVGKDILDKLVELAEKEQIQKEYEVLTKLYNNVKATYPKDNDNKHDFTFYKGYMEYAMEQEGIKGKSYYSDEAYTKLMAHIKQDCATTNEANRYNTKGETKKAVEKELKGLADEKDKMSRQYIKNAEENNAVDARYNKFHRTAEELKTISEKDLKNKLGNNLFNKLAGKNNDGYLSKPTVKNNNGTYNLTGLVEIFNKQMGDDYEIDKQQPAISEFHLTKNKLEGELDIELSNKEYEKLRKLCAVEVEKKDHSLGGALGLNSLKDGLIGAIASFLTSEKVVMNQEMRVTFPADFADDILNQAKQLGYDVTITELANGDIAMTLGQHMLKDTRLLQALAGAGIGVLQGLLLSMIVGNEKDENACFSITDFDPSDKNDTNFDSYKARIEKEYPTEKAKLIIALASTFVDKESGVFNYTEYQGYLTNMAGKGSLLGCDEINGNKIVSIKETKPEAKADLHKIALNETKGTDAEFANIPTIDGTRTTWQKVTEMYGDCLSGIEVDKNKYPNCARRRGELAIRLVKVAQAVTDGNYSYERLMDLAEKTFAAKRSTYTELQGYEGINHEILVNTMKATELGKDVRVPDELAGCKKINNEVQKEIVTDQTKDIVKAQDRGNTQYKVKDGTAGKYYAKLDGKVYEFNTFDERLAAIDNFIKTHHDNVEYELWEE